MHSSVIKESYFCTRPAGLEIIQHVVTSVVKLRPLLLHISTVPNTLAFLCLALASQLFFPRVIFLNNSIFYISIVHNKFMCTRASSYLRKRKTVSAELTITGVVVDVKTADESLSLETDQSYVRI